MNGKQVRIHLTGGTYISALYERCRRNERESLYVNPPKYT